jgi:hypothetical protein
MLIFIEIFFHLKSIPLDLRLFLNKKKEHDIIEKNIVKYILPLVKKKKKKTMYDDTWLRKNTCRKTVCISPAQNTCLSVFNDEKIKIKRPSYIYVHV